jgi:LysM repeat protein
LGKIAGKYHVTTSQIKSWNHLHSSTIRVGQKLKLYSTHSGSGSTTAKSSTVKKSNPVVSSSKTPATEHATASASIDKNNDTKPTATTNAPAPKKDGYIYYKAKSGDTLWDIAQRHGTTVAEIKKLNGASKCNNLKAGTVLKLSSKG